MNLIYIYYQEAEESAIKQPDNRGPTCYKDLRWRIIPIEGYTGFSLELRSLSEILKVMDRGGPSHTALRKESFDKPRQVVLPLAMTYECSSAKRV